QPASTTTAAPAASMIRFMFPPHSTQAAYRSPLNAISPPVWLTKLTQLSRASLLLNVATSRRRPPWSRHSPSLRVNRVRWLAGHTLHAWRCWAAATVLIVGGAAGV